MGPHSLIVVAEGNVRFAGPLGDGENSHTRPIRRPDEAENLAGNALARLGPENLPFSEDGPVTEGPPATPTEGFRGTLPASLRPEIQTSGPAGANPGSPTTPRPAQRFVVAAPL